MENEEIKKVLKNEILRSYSSTLSDKDKKELKAVSKFLDHFITEQGVEEMLEIIE
jgi:hypothetical protein